MPAAALLQLIGKEAGRDLTLGQLNALANKITQSLRQESYMVAFAYVPPREVKDGQVEIDIVPGKYGQINLLKR